MNWSGFALNVVLCLAAALVYFGVLMAVAIRISNQ